MEQAARRENFGTRFKVWVQTLGLTQKELAMRAGVSQNTVSTMATTRHPKGRMGETLRALARAAGKDGDEVWAMLVGEEPPNRPLLVGEVVGEPTQRHGAQRSAVGHGVEIVQDDSCAPYMIAGDIITVGGEVGQYGWAIVTFSRSSEHVPRFVCRAQDGWVLFTPNPIAVEIVPFHSVTLVAIRRVMRDV